MDIEEAKAERTQLEMAMCRLVDQYNEKTGARVTEIRVTYSFSSPCRLAETLKDTNGWFREWFVAVVALADETYKRPDSVFQHIEEMLAEWIDFMKNNKP